MNHKLKTIRTIGFELLSPSEGNGNILELLDESGNCFAHITIDDNDKKYIVWFESSDRISVSLLELEKAIQIAKAEVMNVNPDILFREE